MTKTKYLAMIVTIIALSTTAIAYAMKKPPESGSTPEQRCMQRIKEFTEIANDNKEVNFIFIGLLKTVAILNPELSESEVVKLVADKIIQSCMNDES